MDIDAKWSAFARGDIAARDALLAEHLNLVHHVARQLSRALAAPTDLDELVSCGAIGLMSALESFDASRGLAFSTFAVPRIRGAMLDELRRQDHVPRSIRRKSRSLTHARENLSRIFGRTATDPEIAEHLGIDLATLWKWEADTEGAVHVSLDQSSTDNEGNSHNPLEMLTTEHTPSVEDDLANAQEKQLLQQAIRTLKDQERIVLTLYYFEDLKLHEIAEVLHLTESRVSQIRSKALSRLRTALAPMREGIA